MQKKKNRATSMLYQPSYQKRPLKVKLFIGHYLDNHSLYIGVITARNNEPYTDLTVNVRGSERLASFQAAVKNYSENEGIERFIQENNLGAPTGETIRTGFVTVTVYQFDREKLLEHSVNGTDEYEEAKAGTP